MATIADVPPYDAYMWPIIERLKVHGRSLANDEMVDDIASHMGLTAEVRAVPHGRTAKSEVDYRMAWARTYLKKAGAVENSARGVWRLTRSGAALTAADVRSIPRMVQQQYAIGRTVDAPPDEHAVPSAATATAAAAEFIESPDVPWAEALLRCLQQMEPAAFERLCQRLLREAGFTRVEVTGKSGDGGIDGTGVLRMNLLSFQVIFQCKRWQGSVGASVVRDFRGAMVGRADKGLILTTASFTSDARREATRDGAPAIDLVDGDALCDLLKEHRIGVTVEMVERVTIDRDTFGAF